MIRVNVTPISSSIGMVFWLKIQLVLFSIIGVALIAPLLVVTLESAITVGLIFILYFNILYLVTIKNAYQPLKATNVWVLVWLLIVFFLVSSVLLLLIMLGESEHSERVRYLYVFLAIASVPLIITFKARSFFSPLNIYKLNYMRLLKVLRYLQIFDDSKNERKVRTSQKAYILSFFSFIFFISVPIIYAMVLYSTVLLGFENTGMISWSFNIAIGVPFLALSLKLRQLRNRVVQAEDSTIVGSDSRPAVLFLRSFQDDGVSTALGWRLLFNPFKAYATVFGRGQLEQTLFHVYKRIGPFLALANSEQVLPEYGAIKYSAGSDWKDIIIDWIRFSSAIVLIAGRSHWVGWEIDRILEMNADNKLVIIFPPDKQATLKAREVWLLSYFGSTRYNSYFNNIDLKLVIAIVFRGNSTPVLIECGDRNRFSYEAAAHLAVAIMARNTSFDSRL